MSASNFDAFISAHSASLTARGEHRLPLGSISGLADAFTVKIVNTDRECEIAILYTSPTGIEITVAHDVEPIDKEGAKQIARLTRTLLRWADDGVRAYARVFAENGRAAFPIIPDGDCPCTVEGVVEYIQADAQGLLRFYERDCMRG